MTGSQPRRTRRKVVAASGLAVVITGGVFVQEFGLLADNSTHTMAEGGEGSDTTADALSGWHPRSIALAKTRRSCSVTDLDAFIEAQQLLVETSDQASDWRVLAEAYLERTLSRSVLRGMAVGQPVFSDLPKSVVQDLDRGDAALTRARSLGDASSETYRLEAALRSCRITGVMSAWKHQGAAGAALETALELDPNNLRAQIALACRWLFTPFGTDPVAAERELLRIADALEADERPLILAAFAAMEQGDAKRALAHLQRASSANPNNPYAQAVVRRLEAGEENAFSRDVESDSK